MIKNKIKKLWLQYSRDPVFIKVAIILGTFLIIWAIFIKIFGAPGHFPSGTIFEIKQGESLIEVSKRLEEEKIIKSAFMFRNIIFIKGGEKKIMLGFYYFTHRQNMWTVASRVLDGDYYLETIRITIPEGTNRFVMADIFESKLPRFSSEEFLHKTKNDEGYLFPDTYVFLPHADTNVVIQAMSSNYERKIQPLRESFEKFGKTEKEIITMASIIEGEARQYETRKIIAGILWKRLSINMPLQVDTAFVYINGKTTFDLTRDDLADSSSPYNTYTHKGLPPTPISNPGLNSIEATLNPVKTNYLYFLTGHDGIMYYASTHEGHVVNKQKHLQ
jgi:UPF0755 protein